MAERIEADTSKPRSRIITEKPGNITVSCFVKGNGDKNRKQPDRDDINEVHPWCVLTKHDPRHVRFTPKSRHPTGQAECPLWAKSGHRTTVNRKTASVAVVAKSDQVYRLVTAVAFFHCEANRAAYAILKNLGGDFVAWLSSSSE